MKWFTGPLITEHNKNSLNIFQFNSEIHFTLGLLLIFITFVNRKANK